MKRSSDAVLFLFRDYLPDPVPRDAITRLIDAAIQAPSAMN